MAVKDWHQTLQMANKKLGRRQVFSTW